MEETLFETDGTPVVYLAYDDENTFYLWDGTPVAYLESHNEIYGYNGKHLGWYENGVIRDLTGKIVGYNKKTLPVFPEFENFKAFKKFKPFKSFKEFAKMKPTYSNNESNITLSQFLFSGKK